MRCGTSVVLGEVRREHGLELRQERELLVARGWSAGVRDAEPVESADPHERLRRVDLRPRPAKEVREIVERAQALFRLDGLEQAHVHVEQALEPHADGVAVERVADGGVDFLEIELIDAAADFRPAAEEERQPVLAAKLATIRAERRAKLADVEQKYRLRVELELVNLALISLMGTPYTVLMPVFAEKILGGGPNPNHGKPR